MGAFANIFFVNKSVQYFWKYYYTLIIIHVYLLHILKELIIDQVAMLKTFLQCRKGQAEMSFSFCNTDWHSTHLKCLMFNSWFFLNWVN